MNKIKEKIAKNIFNVDIDVKKNYKTYRKIQNFFSFFKYKNNYNDRVIKLIDRDIKIRIFNENNINNGLIIYIHGGGWVLGSVETYTKICNEISELSNKTVVSIDYRLAPEYPYPCGFNDCYDVIKLICNNFDSNNICLMGDSAGANLIAGISLKSNKTKEFKVKKQILVYPALQSDYSNNTRYKSVITKGKNYLLTQKHLQDYLSLYIKNKEDLKDCYAFPLNKKLFFSQPKTLVITAENDPLCDEGKKYYKRLKLCLNKVKYYNIKGAMHGFLTQKTQKKYKNEVLKKIIEFLGD